MILFLNIRHKYNNKNHKNVFGDSDSEHFFSLTLHSLIIYGKIDGTKTERLCSSDAERNGNGSADVVPGVSGGTIAFIVGIYDELINSIKSINLESLKLFFSGKWATFWKKINGNFLFFLLAGIGISVFSLAKLITWLLINQPILVWSFFFGLVLASTWFVSKDIKEWKSWKTWVAFVIGAVVAFYITVATPAETPSNLLSSSCAELLPFVP